jgi:site-specific recombinase XerD
MHRMLLMLLYATGMRRTEASLMKVSDIDSQRIVIRIHRGKGLRDRDVPLIVFKKYSQMKLQMKREALIKLNRQANEQGLNHNLSYDTARVN